MRAPLLLPLLLVPGLALGQTNGTLTLTLEGLVAGDTLVLGRDSCGQNRRVTWQFTGTQVPCSDLRLWLAADGAPCGNVPGAGDFEFDTVTATDVFEAPNRTGTTTFLVTELPLFSRTTADGGAVSCPAEGRQTTHRVCGALQPRDLSVGCPDSDSGFVRANPTRSVRFDAQPPGRPTIDRVQAADEALVVRVSGVEASALVAIEVQPPEGEFTERERADPVPNNGSIIVDGLTNSVTYQVRARAVDQAGNASEPSDPPASGTPVLTQGFFGALVDSGVQESGGCGVAGSAAAGGGVLLALGLWVASRRQR